MTARLIFSPRYNTDMAAFGIDKPFALDRGIMVLGRLEAELGHKLDFIEPQPLSMNDILLVHTQDYLESLNDAKTWIEIFELQEGEYKPEMARRCLPDLLDDLRLKSGGTKLAAELCLEHGLAANLGGGYHHAFPARGRGYCVIHDVAIAVRTLQRSGKISRAMIIDLDFHQGDGSAVIFHGDASVFTLSVHSEEGWPEVKQESTLDVGIREHEQHLYLEKTQDAVNAALSKFSPDIVLFIAGSDPYEKDVLPGSRFIRLSLDVMRRRDEFIIDTCVDKGIPAAMVFAGGYGPDVWEVHYLAVRRLLERSGINFGKQIGCN